MRISHLRLKNWKNFTEVDVKLRDRVFIVGPNASGKSNLLDVFRFLKKIATTGFKEAVEERGGVSKIRCLSARRSSDIEIEVALISDETRSKIPDWRYYIAFSQDNNRNPILVDEKVWKKKTTILERPDGKDKKDSARLFETALEKNSTNKDFRDISDFFQSIRYMHLVPQIIRNPGLYTPLQPILGDPFGSDFLGRIAETSKKIQESRLKKIQKVLEVAVQQLENLSLIKDKRGIPHLVGKYQHWRGTPAGQNEIQFSDGTLRLIGLLWALFEGEGPLLLEEPELSLHAGFVKKLAPLMHRLQRLRGVRRQILVSTHSADLLSDDGIDGSEVLVLYPSSEGTKVQSAIANREIKALLESGMTVAEAVIPHSEPKDLDKLVQLNFFK
jgi:predicted ATPase